MMMEHLLLVGQTHPNVRDVCEGSKWWGSPPAKKAWTESPVIQKSKSHKASHPLHGMNGKSVKDPRRDWNTKRCIILHLPQLQSWSTSSLRSVPLTNPQYLIHRLCGVWTSLLSGSKSTYSDMTHWLQQSQSNIDHFWKKDMQP